MHFIGQDSNTQVMIAKDVLDESDVKNINI